MKHAITIIGIATLLAGMAPAYAKSTKAPTAQTSEEDLFQQGEVKMQNEDFKGALDDYNRALQLNSQDVHAYVSRGMARFELKDKQGAIDDLTQAIELNPNDAEVYRKRGGIYMILGNKKAAREDLQQAAKIVAGSRDSGGNSQSSSTFQLQQ